ncbi:protein transport protein Sec24C isoform X2 [Bombyx mandarina]|uniref:Protein transport protein Sec24C isoform X2 n=1 Tax=Bombyx mandarina TaxID=7092 RepID=A0A6J2KLM8_BOMMA|nr:protein transport protein Sec24C isoform X2 [Bombyx mandarina]
MMNPQYPPPGQNNNAPNNPIYPPSSQEYNGVQNANIYSQMPAGPQKQFDQDMAQKMQNMNINGSQGFNIPPTQLPPGQAPPNFGPGQGQRPAPMPIRPPAGGQFPPMTGQRPPSATGQALTAQEGFETQRPPSQPMPPMSQPLGISGQMPPHSKGGFPYQPIPVRPGMPPNQPTAGMVAQPGAAPQPGPGMQGPPQSQSSSIPTGIPQSRAGPIPGQPGLNPQSLGPQSGPGQGAPPHPGQMPRQGLSQPGQSSLGPQHGLPPTSQGLPLQPGMSPQPPQLGPGLQQQTGQRQPPHLGQQGTPTSQPSFPQQPGQIPSHPGQAGFLSQPGPPGLPAQPVQAGQPQPGPPGLPTQGLPSQPSHPGLPPQPSQGLLPQPGLPPQPGFPQQPGFGPQGPYQQMPGMPHMPPPLAQQRQFPNAPAQPGYGAPPGPPTSAAFPGMPPLPPQGHGQQYQGQPSGYPPQYQPPFPAQQPSYPGQQYQPPQKTLDPDQMPSPIEVMLDDQQNRGGVFVTNGKGLVPPLVTTDFIVDDKGNASPRYIRSSMYTVPVTADLLKQTAMPFCLVVSPMAETVGQELEPPLLDFAALTGSPGMGPVRCCRCKAYMCPNMKFVDAGRHFKCAFCKATTEVPMEYTQYVNSMQQYGRVPAEMALGAYEIVATTEYCRNNTLPKPPATVFVLDVSYNAVKSGLVDAFCENILDIIRELPKDEQGKSYTRVGFITYSSTVHFYNIKGSLGQAQMLSVGDVGDMFVPILEGFLERVEDSGSVLASLLEQIPAMFRENKETETVMLPAVQAGLEALKAADTAGQLFVFHTTLPTYNAPGKLVNREDRKLLGTDKEKQILGPQNTAYNELGAVCSAAGVAVQLFACNNAYIDAATVGQLPRLTGGQLYKYTYFTAECDGARLLRDVRRALRRPAAHDAVMRLRTSTGVRPTDFYGHFFMSNTTDVELAVMDADKAVGIEVKHDDKLTAEEGVYVQAALLYTHRSGQRRLRVLNLALSVAHQLADVYRSMELDTCINFLTKQAVWAVREAGGRAARQALGARCARSLAAYRRHCASPSAAGQLVLPESMKLLPLYTCCLLRSDALAGGPDITCDDRSCAMYRALTADVATSVVYTYPRLLPLHKLADSPDAKLTPLRASIDKMNEFGVYLLENGVHMLLWVGSQAPAEFVRDVFGVSSPQQIEPTVCELPVLDTPISRAVRAQIEHARDARRLCMRLLVVHQYDKKEVELRKMLVEDRGVNGAESYTEYLLATHKQVQKMM